MDRTDLTPVDPALLAGEQAIAAPAEEESALEVPAEPAPTVPAWEGLSAFMRRSVVEAVIFAAERPIAFKELRDLLGADRASLKGVLEELRRDLSRPERGLDLVEVAGGYALRTRAELAPWMRVLVHTRPPRLSRAALETLAIVAYRQPTTRAEVEEIRGVESGAVLRSLLEKRLIRILGRKNDIGRPLIYGTTREFLDTFNLKDLGALPPLAEIRDLTRGRTLPAGEGESTPSPAQPPSLAAPTGGAAPE